MNQFRRAISALDEAQVNFVVIGGFSTTVHGSAHITYDLDICYGPHEEN